MKKVIIFAVMALAVCGASFGQSYNKSIVKTIALSTGVQTNAYADATYVVPAGERISLLSIYQGVTTQTNTCVVKLYLNGLTSAEAVTVVSPSAVTNTSAFQNVGEGLSDVTTADIVLVEGDTLWLDATGAAASNVVYKIVVKQTKQ